MGTYVRTDMCENNMIPTGRDFGLAEWINNSYRKTSLRNSQITFISKTRSHPKDKTKFNILVAGVDVLCLKLLEAGHIHVGDQGVELVGGVLVFIAKSGQTDTNSERNVPEKKKEN